ncbi:MAG: hypothetical protein N3A38_15395 [Planctomycetota bacterium]|nr:hypothetical protein [Planctomycetota bacterium]
MKGSVTGLVGLRLFVCLAAAAAPAASMESKPEMEGAFAKLKTLCGKEYIAARDEFLRQPDAGAFLAAKCDSDKGDWLAFALQRYCVNAGYAALVNRYLDCEKDRFGKGKDRIGPWMFDWGCCDGIFWGMLPDIAGPAVRKLESRPDYLWEISLFFEAMVRNPRGWSENMRFWCLYRAFFFLPVDKASLARWMIYGQRKGLAVPDYERIRAWLERITETESDPAVLLPCAAKLPGEKSARVLKDLSRREGMVGALAALLYAGQVIGVPGVGHPFNGPWLEEWAKSATAGQIEAVAAIFSEKESPKGSRSSGPPRLLGVSNLVLGIFARQRPSDVPGFFGEKYLAEIKNEVESFKNAAMHYEPNEGNWTLHRAFKTSILWMPDVEKDLNAIATPHPEARKLVEQALANVRRNKGRTSPYPTGEELQAILGNPMRTE